MFHAFVHILLAICEPPVDQTGELLGHRGDGFGRAESCPEASIVGAQGALTVQQRLRRQAPGVGGTVDHVAGAAFAHLAPADPVVGTQTEPGGEVWFGFPPAPIQAARGDEGVRGEPRGRRWGRVDAPEAVEVGVQIDVRLVASGLFGPTLGGGRGAGVDRDLAVNGVGGGCEAASPSAIFCW
jgi:hypothetical protein